ncbi:oligosaccharide flippase family protein [Myroides injenensis]|uniref:oligosaccharide flippase family protein n=1 Tax=Myroides injenensis TaxID=1183151 RepID=UPI000289379A|nr:oligosaccharide flippase family protein [Myroides injenensis]
MSEKNSFLEASKWSMLTEVGVKFISPLSFLVLTRFLSPSDFGVVAIATSILGFMYIISDLGVSKVIIQNDGDEQTQLRIQTVGFCINTAVGFLLFLFLFFGGNYLGILLKQENAGEVISFMSLQVLFYSLSSIQTALLKKRLEFKKLFYVRIITVLIPLLIAIPIAVVYQSYWALVISNVLTSAISCLTLWSVSSWRPMFYLFDFELFNKVFSNSIWNTVEQLFIMIPVLLDSYLLTSKLSAGDYGMYNTARVLFSSCTSLSLGALIPVLFSTLSKLRFENYHKFINFLLISQRGIFSLGAVLSLGGFLFSDFLEDFIFNDQWLGIAKILSVIFFIMGMEYFNTSIVEGFRAEGKFRLLALNSVVGVGITIPLLFLSVNYGLFVYVIVRSLCLYLNFPIIIMKTKKVLQIKYMNFVIQNIGSIVLIVVIFLLKIFLGTTVENVLLDIILFSVFVTYQIYRERKFVNIILSKFFKKKPVYEKD